MRFAAVNWGSVPDWIAAVGSVIAMLLAVSGLLYEMHKRRLTEAETVAERRAAEAVANEEAEETAPADEQDVALSLHCFSDSESHAPRHADDDPAEAPALDGGPDALPVKELARLMADLQALTTRAGTVLCDEAMRLPLHCFSRPESHHPGQGP